MHSAPAAHVAGARCPSEIRLDGRNKDGHSMRVTMEAKTLAAALADVKPARVGRNFPPVDGKVRIDVLDGVGSTFRVTISRYGPDLEQYRTELVPGSIDGCGSVVVDAAALAGALKGAKARETVTLEDDAQVLRIKRNGQTTSLRWASAGEWPKGTDPAAFELAAEILTSSILEASRHGSSDDLRPIFTGMLLEADGTICATDSYRLTMIAGTGTLLEAPVLIPVSIAATVKRWKVETVTLEVARGNGLGGGGRVTEYRHFRLSAGAQSIVGRLIDGDFPNYGQLLPSNCPQRVTLDAGALRSFCASVPSSKNGTPVKLTAGTGIVTASYTIQDVGEGSIDLPAELLIVHPAGHLAAFNATFLGDFLPASGPVVLEGTDALKPWQVIDGKSRRLLMPVRVEN